jgi:hypothetical protein
VTQSRRRDPLAAASSAAAAPTEATSSPAAAAAAAGATASPLQQVPQSADTSDSTLNLSSLPSRAGPQTQQQQQQQQQSGGASQPQHQLTLGSSLRRLQQQQQQAAAVRHPAVRDAYAGLRDPTVASGSYTITQDVILRTEQLKFFSSPPDIADDLTDAPGSTTAAAAGGGGAAGGCVSAAGAGSRRGGVSGSDALSPEGPQHLSTAAAAAAAAAAAGKTTTAEGSRVAGHKRPAEGSHSKQGSAPEVLKKLAASAPQLPISGDDWLLAEYGVNQHGMELYNHWGAVDSSVGLPKER